MLSRYMIPTDYSDRIYSGWITVTRNDSQLRRTPSTMSDAVTTILQLLVQTTRLQRSSVRLRKHEQCSCCCKARRQQVWINRIAVVRLSLIHIQMCIRDSHNTVRQRNHTLQTLYILCLNTQISLRYEYANLRLQTKMIYCCVLLGKITIY